MRGWAVLVHHKGLHSARWLQEVEGEVKSTDYAEED